MLCGLRFKRWSKMPFLGPTPWLFAESISKDSGCWVMHCKSTNIIKNVKQFMKFGNFQGFVFVDGMLAMTTHVKQLLYWCCLPNSFCFEVISYFCPKHWLWQTAMHQVSKQSSASKTCRMGASATLIIGGILIKLWSKMCIKVLHMENASMSNFNHHIQGLKPSTNPTNVHTDESTCREYFVS
jgi:hypothetical protein